MPSEIPADSVGLVKPEIIHFSDPLELQCGQMLGSYDIALETYGELNSERNNAVLVCHALTGHHHAAGFHKMSDTKPGWWDNCIGPGKAIDTRTFFVVCINNLGGCHGSTGPASLNSKTGKPWGADFPNVTVEDWVEVQSRMAEHLGIDVWAAVVGGSLGGMQVIQWAARFPHKLRHGVVIASAAKLSAQNIAFNEVARQAILSDSRFCEGRYLDEQNTPKKGLGLARMIGHITYLSDVAMGTKFGREMKGERFSEHYDVEFQVESYLRYQAEAFSSVFDANSYLLMTRVLDYFDPAAEFDGVLANVFSRTEASFFVVSFSTDWRFSPARSREIVDALVDAGRDVSYMEVEAPQGHDAFLMDIPRYIKGFSAYMQRVAATVGCK